MQNRKLPTATDVAKLAGVSRTQVSYVMNNIRMSHVSTANRQKIMEAADKLGYQPHSSAQTLRRGYSKEFSIFFPAPYPPRINRVIGMIHEKGLVDGFTPIQYSFHSYENKERKYQSLHAMLNKKPYAVFCSLFDLERKDIDYMLETGVRKVLVWDVNEHIDLPSIHLPIVDVGKLAAEHLQSHGYRQVGFIKPSDPIQNRAFELRLKGFLDGWKGSKSTDIKILDWPKASYRPTLKSARKFIDSFGSPSRLPEAIYGYADDYALTLMAALRELGIRIPEDVAILGTDNIDYCELSQPKLTSIQLDSSDLGLRAVAMMNHLITGEALDERFNQRPTPILIERGST